MNGWSLETHNQVTLHSLSSEIWYEIQRDVVITKKLHLKICCNSSNKKNYLYSVCPRAPSPVTQGGNDVTCIKRDGVRDTEKG